MLSKRLNVLVPSVKAIGVGHGFVEASKVYFNELRCLFHCRPGHGRNWANRGRVAVRPYSNAGADADSSALHRQGIPALYRPRMKRVRPASGRWVQDQWRYPEVRYLGHLNSPHGLVTPGSKRTDDLPLSICTGFETFRQVICPLASGGGQAVG